MKLSKPQKKYQLCGTWFHCVVTETSHSWGSWGSVVHMYVCGVEVRK